VKRAEYISVRNWRRYQHYKDRRPLWIKLYTDMPRDRELRSLPLPARLLSVLLLCVAADRDNQIPNNSGWLSAEVNMTASAVQKALKELHEVGYIHDWNPTGDPAEGWGTRYIKPEIRTLILERDGAACVTCSSTESLEIDHVIPVSKGGSSEADNLQVLCRSCNRRKRAKLRSGFAPQESPEVATQLRSLETYTEELPPSVEPNGSTSVGAQSLVEWFVDESRLADREPPRTVVGQVASQVKSLLGDGFAEEQIQAGLRLLIDKGKHPSILPSLVYEAQAAPTHRRLMPRFGRGITTEDTGRALQSELDKEFGQKELKA